MSRRDVVIAPLSVDGTRPYGFISHVQGRRIGVEGITAEILAESLARKLPRQILPFMIYNAAEAGDFRTAEARMRPLAPLFGLLTAEEAQTLARGAVENGQVWLAKECREEFLPRFIAVQSGNIDPQTLRALAYQIEHGEWHRSDKQE